MGTAGPLYAAVKYTVAIAGSAAVRVPCLVCRAIVNAHTLSVQDFGRENVGSHLAGKGFYKAPNNPCRLQITVA